MGDEVNPKKDLRKKLRKIKIGLFNSIHDIDDIDLYDSTHTLEDIVSSIIKLVGEVKVAIALVDRLKNK